MNIIPQNLVLRLHSNKNIMIRLGYNPYNKYLTQSRLDKKLYCNISLNYNLIQSIKNARFFTSPRTAQSNKFNVNYPNTSLVAPAIT